MKVLLLIISLSASLAACAPASMGPGDGTSGLDGGAGTVTYWRNIRAITEANCVGCHSSGGIGPFPLNSYANAREVAPLMAAVTASRRMPPWPPGAQMCRELTDPRLLSQDQIDTIGAWVRAGTPEGNPADYVAPPPRTHQLPATAEISLQPATAYTPRAPDGRNDDYHCFVLDPNLATTRDLIGLRVTPGNGAIVHHMLLFEVRAAALDRLRALDDAEPGDGYTCFGGPRINANVRQAPPGSAELLEFDMQQLGGWAPGSSGGMFPPTTGLRLAPGSRIVMQIHYNLTAGAGGSDQTRVEMFLSPTPVANQAMWIPEAQTRFLVPAGVGPTDPRATVQSSGTPFRLPARIWGTFPHMHQRGSAIRSELTHPDGSRQCLVNIPAWDFHWQQSYFFRSPIRTQVTAMGATSRTQLTCVYDNTAANQPIVNGMQAPPRDLQWGEGTDDEMCLIYYYTTL